MLAVHNSVGEFKTFTSAIRGDSKGERLLEAHNSEGEVKIFTSAFRGDSRGGRMPAAPTSAGEVKIFPQESEETVDERDCLLNKIQRVRLKSVLRVRIRIWIRPVPQPFT